jgi:uncharacterized protein YggU (UPF0235/DUF167 family)
MPGLRVNVRAYPNAHGTVVGGRYGTSDPPVLIVRVNVPATDGRANQAVIDALADAFGVSRRSVTLRTGSSNRNKLFEIEGGDPAVLEAILTP